MAFPAIYFSVACRINIFYVTLATAGCLHDEFMPVTLYNGATFNLYIGVNYDEDCQEYGGDCPVQSD